MRWLWWRTERPSVVTPKPRATEGERARKKAEKDLQAIREETPRYEELARSLRRVVQDNHLGEALTNALRDDR